MQHAFRCDFAVKQADCTVDEEVSTVLKNFHSAKKPIGYVYDKFFFQEGLCHKTWMPWFTFGIFCKSSHLVSDKPRMY